MTNTETNGWVLVPRDMPQDYLEFYEGVMMDEGRKGPGAAKKAWAALLKLVAATKPLSASPKGDDLEPVAWMWEELVDPTESVVVGGTVTRFATHWSTPPKSADVTPLVPASALQSLKAERDAARQKAVEQHGRAETWLDAANGWMARFEDAEAENATLKRAIAELREALTPSSDTKAAYIGEFTIAIERQVNEDEEPDDEAEGAPDPYEHITVPWTTIKEIMAAILDRATQGAAALKAKP